MNDALAAHSSNPSSAPVTAPGGPASSEYVGIASGSASRAAAAYGNTCPAEARLGGIEMISGAKLVTLARTTKLWLAAAPAGSESRSRT
ncbi:MAG: hypothetical protein HYV07_24975 [Deltaproteobacteria bacterium]|nr:hypothetical protein [Deltaproteobacteria bacterium]